MIATLVEAALRSLVLALAVWTGLRVFRVRNVVAQKIAWGLVLGAASLMPVLAPWLARFVPASAAFVVPRYAVTSPAQPQPTAPTTAEPASATVADIQFERRIAPAPVAKRRSPVHAYSTPAPAPALEMAPALNVASIPAIDAAGPAAPVSAQSAALPVVPKQFSVSLPSMAIALYLVVAGVFVARLLWGLFSAMRLLLTAKRIREQVDAALSGGASLRASRAVASPVTIGSTVVLPASYLEWDREKLRIVLAHERSHIRQGDFYLQLLAGLYAALVWFSPLGWWLKRELSDLAETISDRAGLEEAASTTSYAQILLEFAATPRPTVLGVAMARSGSLSRRIERLLNDHAFSQAFAGGRRRALVAVLLVPAALVATTTLIRVQAAQDLQTAPAPAASPTDPAAPSPAVAPTKPSPAHPATDEATEIVSDDETDSSVVVAPRVIVIPAVPKIGPIPPIPAISINVPRIPPMPPFSVVVPKIPPMPPIAVSVPKIAIAPMTPVRITPGDFRFFAMAQDDDSSRHRGHAYRYVIDGDSYAVIRGDHSESMNFNGDMHSSEIEKARKLAHGDFLWFEHDDKEYYVDDPAILSQIEAMYKPMEELGKKQEDLGRQQEELGRQQEALGQQQEQASVPAPDMQRELAEIDAAMSKLKAKMGQNVTQDELGDLQNKLGDLQGKLGDLQGKIGAKQGELGAQQGRLGEQQGRLGAEQGRLGAEQGRIGREADRKVRSIIAESLQNGKAHPVN